MNDRSAGQTILESWVLTELARADQLTATDLAERLSIPRAMVIDALVELAVRGLIEDGSPDEPEEPAGFVDNSESPVSMRSNADCGKEPSDR